jgi:putative endonuclease
MGDRVLPAVYLLASRRHGTLYLGSAAHLIRRIWEHRHASGGCFSAKYDVKRLVWYQLTATIVDARYGEMRMKRWRREWKTNLIEKDNPHWDDLYPAICGQGVLRG